MFGDEMQRTASCLVATFVMILLCGCGGGKPAGYSGPTGTVSGTVKSATGPIPEGAILSFELVASGDRFVTFGKVGADGTFKIDGDVRVGSYIVTVTPPSQPTPEDPSVPPPPPQSYPGIPESYRVAGSSALKPDVKAGPNTIELELK